MNIERSFDSFMRHKICTMVKLLGTVILTGIIAYSAMKIHAQTDLSCIKSTGIEPKSVAEPCTYDKSIVNEGQKEYCFSYLSNYTVSRGCIYNPENQQFKEKCLDPNDANCLLCEKSNCNVEKMIHTCYECDSSKNFNCLKNLDTIVPKVCIVNRVRQPGCYQTEINGAVKRGCLADLPLAMQIECKNNGDCKICDGDNCNKRRFQNCHTCNSADDSDCAINPWSTNTAICRLYNDTCFTKIENQNTIRGCTSDYLAENHKCENYLCSTCEGYKCNNAIFPKKRLQCHQCFGTLDEPCSQSLNAKNHTLESCANYNKYDFCYESLDTKTSKVLYRGCLSDNTIQAEFCSSSKEGCNICSTDGCNSHPPYSNSSLKCIICNENDRECPWGILPSEAQDCTNKIPLGYSALCYQKKDSNGNVTRGCTSTNDQICNGLDGKNCRVCTENSCNNENFLLQNCISCDTSILGEEFCVDKIQDELYSVLCGKFSTYSEQGCYTYRKSLLSYDDTVSNKNTEEESFWEKFNFMKSTENAINLKTNEITRGCAKDFNMATANLTSKDYFHLCYGDNCNIELPKGAAMHNALSSNVILFINLALSIYYFN